MRKILIVSEVKDNLKAGEVDSLFPVLIEEIKGDLEHLAKELQIKVAFFESHSEETTLQRIQQAMDENFSALIMDVSEQGHYSCKVQEALTFFTIPIIEVCMSNINPERNSEDNWLCKKNPAGHISGLGKHVYPIGLRAATLAIDNGSISNQPNEFSW